MPDARAQTSVLPMITAAEPQLRAAIVRRRYRHVMGLLHLETWLSVEFTYGDPPFYAQVKRGAAGINLRCIDRPAIDPARRDSESLLSATIIVATSDGLQQLLLEFQMAGAIIHQPLRNEPEGARDFIVKDPDGNLLLFGGMSVMRGDHEDRRWMPLRRHHV